MKEVPESTLDEKCDSSVAYNDGLKDDFQFLDNELNDSKSTIDELPDSLFDPPSDSLYNSDDDVLQVTSTGSPNENKIENIKEIVGSKLPDPKKVDRRKP